MADVLLQVPVVNRNPGVLQSPSWRVPVDATEVDVMGTIHAGDVTNTALSCWFRFYALLQGVWTLTTGGRWQGNPQGAQPRFRVDLTSFRGMDVRVELDHPVKLRAGVTLMTVDPEPN